MLIVLLLSSRVCRKSPGQIGRDRHRKHAPPVVRSRATAGLGESRRVRPRGACGSPAHAATDRGRSDRCLQLRAPRDRAERGNKRNYCISHSLPLRPGHPGLGSVVPTRNFGGEAARRRHSCGSGHASEEASERQARAAGAADIEIQLRALQSRTTTRACKRRGLVRRLAAQARRRAP